MPLMSREGRAGRWAQVLVVVCGLWLVGGGLAWAVGLMVPPTSEVEALVVIEVNLPPALPAAARVNFPPRAVQFVGPVVSTPEVQYVPDDAVEIHPEGGRPGTFGLKFLALPGAPAATFTLSIGTERHEGGVTFVGRQSQGGYSLVFLGIGLVLLVLGWKIWQVQKKHPALMSTRSLFMNYEALEKMRQEFFPGSQPKTPATAGKVKEQEAAAPPIPPPSPSAASSSTTEIDQPALGSTPTPTGVDQPALGPTPTLVDQPILGATPTLVDQPVIGSTPMPTGVDQLALGPTPTLVDQPAHGPTPTLVDQPALKSPSTAVDQPASPPPSRATVQRPSAKRPVATVPEAPVPGPASKNTTRGGPPFPGTPPGGDGTGPEPFGAGAPSSPPGTILLRLQDDRGREFAGTAREITIGRKKDNVICLSAAEVSRHHATIRADGDGFVVIPISTSNLTTLNGERIDKPVPIKAGDELGLGGTPYQVLDLRPG